MKSLHNIACGLAVLIGLVCGYPRALAQTAPPDSVRHRIILIGDAGRLRQQRNPVVDAVTARYDLNNARTTLLYLGDNVYPRGLPDEGSPDYSAQTDVLRYQAQPGKQSRILFIPGNHDWGKGKPDGWERIRQQGRWIDSLKAPNIRLLPADGCPGPEEIHLSDRLVLIILDTQWWLHPYDKPGTDADCACKTQDEVLVRLRDIAYRNQGKGLILATHHPFRSYGIHGGYYTARQHLFPLTDFAPRLYVPLPGIGSLYPLVRGVFGNIQDLANPTYRQMVRAIETTLAQAPNVVFVSGHDHSIQHIVDNNRSYIVSGSGINRERVKSGKLARFVSPDWGYVVLDELTSGSLNATFYTVDEAATDTQVHAAPIFGRLPAIDSTRIGSARSTRWPDSVTVAIAPAYDSVGGVHRLLLGNNYRQTWATPVTFPVFDLTHTLGGFTILQRGGGMQTKSLRLANADGREWVLRSIQKDPTGALPVALRQTIAKDVLQDEISAGFPFAPLAVASLAEAAGVPHATPRLVYVPDDPALGIYQADFGQSVALLEERNPVDGKSVSTAKVLEALADDNDNRVDQRAVLRARMLDLLIGDWDRHEDQWRWGSRKTTGGKTYYPIPRDRDQAFFRAGGLLPSVAALPWLQPKFQGFATKLGNVNGLMMNARYFDRLFLQELSTRDWINEITDLQATLTDSVLRQAIGQLPEAVRQQSGERLFETLRARRGWLLREGLTYYRFLAKTVDIPGSDKAELFRVDHRDDDHVAVSVYKIGKDGADARRLYYRVFDTSVTREIRLYGQKGNDRFEVGGTQNANVTIRLIGGKGNDVFTVTGTPGKPFIYDRTTEANTLPEPGLARLRPGTDKAINQFDPHAFTYDRLAPLLSAGYNLDDGLLLGAGVQWKTHGFRKAPFATDNRLLISRALATDAVSLRYSGTFTDVIGRNDLVVNAVAKAPTNVSNFFGPGNESTYDQTRRIRYYRTRYNLITASAQLRHTLGTHASISAGPVFQYFSLDLADNRGRFIERYLADQGTAAFLQRESYGGIQAGITLDTRTDPAQPIGGVYWHTTLLGLQGFGQQANHLTQLQSAFHLYTRLDPAGRLVLAHRIGGGLTYGNPAFYQLLYLGGQDNLRGFRNFRFAGNHMLYHSLEARLRLFSFQSFLFPGQVGLTAFHDVGRVWFTGESSHRWHNGYGGGLYVTPASLLVITAQAGLSTEGVLPYVSMGFRF